MMQVQDLKLKEDVLPFFNYTNNEHSEAYLLSLLKNVPETIAAISERQAVTKGIIANWAILENYTYRKLDFLEVHAFFETLINKGSVVKDGDLKESLKLMLSETKRNRQWSKLVQVILLLNDIQRQYISRKQSSAFPESFSAQLQIANTFLNKLRLEYHTDLIKENRFTVSKIVAFENLLNGLEPTEIKAFWNFLFTFEAHWSIAKATIVHGFTFPEFSADALTIEGFYHPIVKNPVKNCLEFDAERNVLLLTGPNMSGKSTLLKAIGLCVYLAHVGFTVPASHCKTPFFHSIAIAINLNDNLRDGYSHFMAEIENLKAVVHSTGNAQKCFAVFDEIFRGTNVDDALDITQTTVNGLAKIKGSYFLISTHLLQLDEHLNSNSAESIKKCYIECVLDKGTPKFSYKLQEGWSQLKIGRVLFEQVGLTEMLEK